MTNLLTTLNVLKTTDIEAADTIAPLQRSNRFFRGFLVAAPLASLLWAMIVIVITRALSAAHPGMPHHVLGSLHSLLAPFL